MYMHVHTCKYIICSQQNTSVVFFFFFEWLLFFTTLFQKPVLWRIHYYPQKIAHNSTTETWKWGSGLTMRPENIFEPRGPKNVTIKEAS